MNEILIRSLESSKIQPSAKTIELGNGEFLGRQ